MSSPPPPSLPPRPELPEGVWRPDPPPPETRPWERVVPLWAPFAIAFAALVLAVLAATIIAAVADLGTGEAEDSPGVILGATFVQDVVLIGGAVLAVALAARVGAAHALGIRRTRFGPAVGWSLAVLVAFWISAGLVVLVFGDSPDQEIAEDIKAESAAIALAGYVAITCLLAPLAEEVFFRGLLFPLLRSRFGLPAGVIGTGALFSFVHAAGSPGETLIVLFVLGAGLCLLYLRTGSLLPCIGLHALNNSIAFAATKEMEWLVALVTVAGSVVVSVAIAMAFLRAPERVAAA